MGSSGKSDAAAFAEAKQDHEHAEQALTLAKNRLSEAARVLDSTRAPLQKLVGQNVRRRVLATGTPGLVVVVTWNPPPERGSGNPIITVDLEEVLHEG